MPYHLTWRSAVFTEKLWDIITQCYLSSYDDNAIT